MDNIIKTFEKMIFDNQLLIKDYQNNNHLDISLTTQIQLIILFFHANKSIINNLDNKYKIIITSLIETGNYFISNNKLFINDEIINVNELINLVCKLCLEDVNNYQKRIIPFTKTIQTNQISNNKMIYRFPSIRINNIGLSDYDFYLECRENADKDFENLRSNFKEKFNNYIYSLLNNTNSNTMYYNIIFGYLQLYPFLYLDHHIQNNISFMDIKSDKFNPLIIKIKSKELEELYEQKEKVFNSSLLIFESISRKKYKINNFTHFIIKSINEELSSIDTKIMNIESNIELFKKTFLDEMFTCLEKNNIKLINIYGEFFIIFFDIVDEDTHFFAEISSSNLLNITTFTNKQLLDNGKGIKCLKK